ncbi:MAG: molecular chaperone HtpG [Legionellaceae bacterium]|nr:molecular chaperone HtpG [Legionellaceae bacterium]
MSNKETRGFETATQQLLHLVTHALYSNKEVFLRELVSNAADAEDKLRFAALDDNTLYGDDAELKIEIEFDKAKKTITVRDNGIGMSREEAIEHLGTIAKSGTKEFLSKLSGDQAKDSKLIGQFGVGFYSAFIVADKVTVNSRKAGEAADKAVRWVSDGSGEYEIEDITKDSRGTEIILELKKDEEEFLDEFRLRNIITKYSDYVDVPIKMQKTITETDEKDKEKKTEKVVWEQVNRGKALWTIPKSQIKDEEFKEFYKHISHDFVDPISWGLNKVEGKQEYTSLLYIPSKAPFDLWDRDHSRGLKLYVRRVFIMDDAEQFLPLYLRFVKGLVDSQDLPLNVSREILQSNKVVEGIKSGVVKRVLSMLETLSKDAEKYQTVWDAFGKVLKEGPGEDFANRERIAKLLRFSTTHDDNEKQTISLSDYVSRMKPEQKHIYYVTAETFNAAKNSPHLEVFRQKGIEVLLLTDNVGEWLVSHLTEFDGKSLQSIAKGDLDLGDLDDKPSEEEKKKEEDEFKSVLEQMKKQLESKVSDVRITHRLTDSPACIVVGENDMSANLQRIMEAAGQQAFMSKPILEINPTHAIIERLKAETDDAQFNEWTEILFDQALLAEGGKLNDPATFVKRLNKMLALV